MTPIDWNDSEPAFPDFLPPLPPKNAQDLTPAQARERLEGILTAAGVKVILSAIGDIYVEFPDGAVCEDNSDSEIYLVCDGLSNGR